MSRADGAPTSPTTRPTAGDLLTVERATAVEPWREFRVHPRDRQVAFTADVAGARQLFVLPLRGGPASQLSASEKSISDPQWSPDGRRLAFLRDDAIWVVDADGSRLVQVTAHKAGHRDVRWSPDGLQLAFVSRRRGWSQIWRIDAPVPRRGRPAAHPRPAEPVAVTPAGLDVEGFDWSPEGGRIAFAAQREDRAWRSDVSVVDVAGGDERRIPAGDAWECAPRWLPDGGLTLTSDADGWFQVVRLDPTLHERSLLTTGAMEHGDPSSLFGFVPLVAPDGARFVHVEIHDGVADLVVNPLSAAPPARRPRGRPPKRPRPAPAPDVDRIVVNPWPGVWRAVGWSADGTTIVALGESERRPPDLWLLPIPGAAPDGARPRRVTDSLPAVLRPARFADARRVHLTARDGRPVEGNLFLPAGATGKRGGTRVPTVLALHGGPTSQSYRNWSPLKQILVREGFAVLDVDFRGSTGYGRDFRLANAGEWGHADAHDCIDAGRWAAAQPWSDGRLAAYGGSYGGYLVLCALADEPAMWRAGVDLFGDSEIAESYRHGDRPGRLDLQRMMGDPDDPAAVSSYRRGSPVYRAERIEAPLLILHGRRDRRVVPLMTERMAEALTIEDKVHEVHWYDEEAHGWERRENRRDAWTRIVAFLKLHVMDKPAPG